MAAQDVLDDWKAWTGEHLVTWNRVFHLELFESDMPCIQFVYNNGNGLPALDSHSVGYQGLLFYRGPGRFGGILGNRPPGVFQGWGRLLPPPWTGSLSPAATTAAGTTLAVRDRGQFPSTPPFWVAVQDDSFNQQPQNLEFMQVTDGAGVGAGDFTVSRGMLGTTAIAHRGHPTNPGQMSWVGLVGEAGDPTTDPPRRIFDPPTHVEWVHIEIPTDATQPATFAFYESDRSTLASEKSVTPSNGGQWDGTAGELNLDPSWWLTYYKTTAG